MTEEVKTEVVQETPVETEARALGWVPKEEFDAEEKNAGKRWRTAEDFLDRKPLFDKIDEIKRENKELQKSQRALIEHNLRIEKLSYEKALKELKEQKKAAREEGDLDKVDEIEEQIDEIKAKKSTVPQLPPQPNVVFEEWISKNDWYQKDLELKAFADGYAQQLINQGIKDPSQGLPLIEKKVRELFAGKFRNPRKDQAPNVETSDRKQKSDAFVLPPEEEAVMNKLIKAGLPSLKNPKEKMTKDEYIEQVKKAMGVK